MSEYKPLSLLKAKTYPGYQFLARLRYDGQTPQQCFRYAALAYLEWLRKKVSIESLPEELNTPPARDFVTTEDSVLRSFHFSGGFVLDITAMPEKGLWAARIREPDTERQGRKGQLGRFFVTETALRVVDRDVVLGVRIDVVDPVNVEHEVDAAFRPAFLRTLFANNRVRLRQAGLLNYQKAHTVPYSSALKHLMELLQSPDRLMPVVVLTYATQQVNIQRLLTRLDERLGLTDVPGSFMERLSQLDLFPQTLEMGQPALPWDADYMTLHTFGYGHVYVIEDEMFPLFKEKLSWENVQPGDMLWLEPKRYGGARRIIRCPITEGAEKLEKARNAVLEEAHRYSKRKEVNWEPLIFEQQLRRMEIEERIHGRLQELRTGDQQKNQQQEEEYRRRQDEFYRQMEELIEMYGQQKTAAEEEAARLARENEGLRLQLAAMLPKERQQTMEPEVSLRAPAVPEYYADEMHDLVLSILQESRNSYCGEGTRAAELLDILLAQNTLTGEGKKLFDQLKIILFRNKNITDADVSDLKELGFEVTRNTDNHYRLVFRGDSRFTFTLPSTGSDVRGLKNSFSKIVRFLSVYK